FAGVRAVSEALQRRGVQANVTSHPLSPTLYQIELKAQKHPKAAIIISAQDGGRVRDRCSTSIRTHTTYLNFQTIVIEDSLGDTPSHSEKLNAAAQATDADFVVFVDDSVEITTARWLDQLVATMQMDGSIGAVAPLLVSPKGKIMHAGIVLGPKDGVGFACRGMDAHLPGDGCRTHALQEYSALTGAMLCVRREAFLKAGRFDSARYPDLYADIDLCLRMKSQGGRCIYSPMIKAIQHSTKSLSESPENQRYLSSLKDDHPDLFNNDPFFNPNLSFDNEWFLGYRNFPIEGIVSSQ
ncbi:MAG: glycosyltransferase family protein, partial [Planctomycetota bacterium]